MYSLAVTRDFIAQHFLFGGDWGEENRLHSHHYRVEVLLEGPGLNQHGYLVDIVDIEKNLDGLVAHFKDRLLNELPEFENLNPSIEHFCRIFWQKFTGSLSEKNLSRITITIWENEIARASYQADL